MEKKSSFQGEKEKGSLYLVATPIGNLQDMTFRAIEILKQSAVIAAEDTRQTRKLLTHFQIEGPRLISYHEHNKNRMEEEILHFLKKGLDVSIVTDAGTPGISDPGEDIVRAAINEGFPVVPIPGAVAAINALIASGLPTGQFSFIGFLPRVRKDRKKELQRWMGRPETLIFYEAPHRLKVTLKDVFDVFGDRKITMARELTKKYEEFIRGTVSEMLEMLQNEQAKGEYVLVVSGIDEVSQQEERNHEWANLTIIEHMEKMVNKGVQKKDAIKLVAKERNLPKREVYNLILEEEQKK